MTELTRRKLLAATLATGALAAGGSVLAGTEAAAATPPTAQGASTRNQTATVYVVRHGQTWLNREGLAQGWSDSPLTVSWAPTAQTIGKNLAARDGRLTAAYSADMVRHFQTATGILQGARSSLTVTRDERLREVAFGGFEGSPGTTMWDAAAGALGHSSMGAALAAGVSIFQLVDAIPSVNPYPADTVAEKSAPVAARMLAALEDIVSSAAHGPNAKILVVSSGLSISCLLSFWGQADRLPPTGLGNGAVNQLTYSRGSWTVDTVNDLSYTS
ncbi:histidine phosphatase family protein [Humibacter sp.]|uniref:histidine phosphatase family protein n=1 Tax=Humibacter sp. TaxID=1940291 RepID=UPI003F7E9A62